ncbi:unnamed protein product [Toxocara canis]|uniref:Sema domain-containing protein n=1 Tax=Toxocara canis TaxID=6265 RepID=A0A183TZU5_TOXCA|nr:unnamed protein product [Toxocara canis]
MCQKRDGRPMARLPGVDVCVFVAHTSSKVKVYTGVMLFNRFNLMTKVPAQGEVSLASLALERRLCISHMPRNNDYAEHLKDGECLRYLSQDQYLLFCCCYESDHWCKYSADHSKESVWNNNAKYWPNDPELRAVYDVPFYDRTATAKEWNYRDFVYSRPCKSHSFLKKKKRNFVTDDNIRLWHCVTGNLSLKSASGLNQTNDVGKVMRRDLPLRGRSCFVDVSVAFRKIGSSIIPESFSKVCLGGVHAFFTNAFTDTAAGKYIFCSHYVDFETGSERLMVYGETFYVPVPKGKDYASHYFSSSKDLKFTTVVVLPLPRPECERISSRHIMQFGVVFCSSIFDALEQGYSCDKGYLDQMRRFANKFERPLCYEGRYKVDVRNSTGEMTEKKTTGSPLCFDEVILMPDNMSVFVTSGTFHPYTDSLSLRLHSPSVAMVNGTIVYHIKQVCAPKNGKPCNGKHLLFIKIDSYFCATIG